MKITSKRIKQYNSTTKRVIFADEEPICIVRGEKRESAIISYLSGYGVALGDLSVKRRLDKFLKDRKEKKPKYIILIIDDNNNILRKINIHGSYKYAYEFMRKIYEDKIEEFSSDVDAQYIGLNSMSISYNDNTIKYLLLTDNKIFKEDDYYEQDETATNKA